MYDDEVLEEFGILSPYLVESKTKVIRISDDLYGAVPIVSLRSDPESSVEKL